MKKNVLLLFAVIIFTSACSVAQGAAPPSKEPPPSATSYGATVSDVEPFSGDVQTPPILYVSRFGAASLKLGAPLAAADSEGLEIPEYEIPEAEKPMIALTFDDGPSKVITPQIVELLEKYGVRATFCVVGTKLEKNMEIGELIFQSGSEMIGHSWNHSYLTKLSADAIEKQLLDTNALIEEITGSAPAFYRPPYGAVNSKVRDVSERLGLSLVMWSVDPKDWKIKTAGIIYERILENLTDGSIIICHDLYESTLEMLEMLIPELLERGYRFVTISELFSETEVLPGKLYKSLK